MQTITKAKISRNNLMEYIHEDRDLLMGLQDDLSDMPVSYTHLTLPTIYSV